MAAREGLATKRLIRAATVDVDFKGLWLFLSLVFQFLDKAFPDAIAACEETAPHMFVTPEIVSSLWVNHCQVCVSCGRLLVVIRDGVFGDVAVVSVACPATREDDVAAFVGVGREKKYQIGQLWIGSKSEFPPFLQLGHRIFPDSI
jgi:hypothetical protein